MMNINRQPYTEIRVNVNIMAIILLLFSSFWNFIIENSFTVVSTTNTPNENMKQTIYIKISHLSLVIVPSNAKSSSSMTV